MSVRNDGWDSDWGTELGGLSPATDTGMDRLGRALRSIIATAMGMPAGSVRPANQIAPRGTDAQPFATVLMMSSEDAGWPETVYSGPDGSTVQGLTVQRYVTASVQFFSAKAQPTDGAIVSTYSAGGYDQALRLPKRLQLDAFASVMRDARIGFIGASPARDITAILNEQWESRGQVDITFSFLAAESAPIGTFGLIGEINIKAESPSGARNDRTIEVNP